MIVSLTGCVRRQIWHEHSTELQGVCWPERGGVGKKLIVPMHLNLTLESVSFEKQMPKPGQVCALLSFELFSASVFCLPYLSDAGLSEGSGFNYQAFCFHKAASFVQT